MLKDIGLALLFVFIVFLLIEGSFLLYQHYAPKYEGVRRQVFEQTKSYSQGMIQELENMQFEYQQAKPQERQALRSIILHRAADYPTERMPSDLRRFITDLKGEGSAY